VRKFSGTLRPNNIVKTTLLLCLLCLGTTLPGADAKPLPKLAPPELAARLETDARTVLQHRDGLQSVIRYLNSRSDLFPTNAVKDSALLRREEKETVWSTWQRFLDYQVALHSIELYHADFFRLKGDAEEDAFLISYAAMLTQYRAALEFITRVDHRPELEKVLNDAVPELGLPAGTYARLKLKYLNVHIVTEFAASDVLLKTFTAGRKPELRKAIAADADFVWQSGKGQRQLMTAKNALKILERGAHAAWLPVQTGVSEWMGDTKVYRIGKSLVTEAQVQALQPRLLPGDVILVRHEWYLSNVGLPGFWPHAALYIGTPEERQAYFADRATLDWVKQQGEPSGLLEALLIARSPEAYKQSVAPQAHHQPVRIIEAISEGVSLTALTHALDVDSLVVLRPRLPKAEKAQALVRAFHYVGRPYDFNFDFSTDAELVCTELVYKSYEPAAGFTGLKLPTVEMLGRRVTPANEIARQFAQQHGTPAQQFDFVAFLDGQEKKQTAVEAPLETFLQSWKRPKWHVVTQ
jgi:hypothetical protein